MPRCAEQFIAAVVRKIRWRRRVREDVRAELTAHFEDELRDVTDPAERERRAKRLIGEFGDPGLLAILCRRAKKRCRPLWAKAAIRGIQVAGVFLLYLVVCTVPLFVGKPTIRVDYADWLTKRWRPAQPGVENARTYYEQAASLYVEPPEWLAVRRRSPQWTVRDCNEADLRLLTDWLSENKAAFDQFRKGANTADYWPVYDVNHADRTRGGVPFMWMEANVVPLAMEWLPRFRSLAMAWRDRVAYQVRRGELDEAMNDSRTLLRFGRHLRGKGLLIEQLVGIAIEALGHATLFDVLQEPGISAEGLARVQDELRFAFDRDRSFLDLDAEKVIWYDNIQRTFTDDGQGGGRALRRGLPFAAGDWRDNLTRMLRFDYPDRRQTVAMVDAYFEQIQEMLRIAPNSKEPDAELEGQIDWVKQNLLFTTLKPAHERLGFLVWRDRTGEAALAATVALLRYKTEKGSFPEHFEDVVTAGLLASLPDDPFGQGPLTYRRTADGFLLYSWGQNLLDDGGRPGTGQDGRPRDWADNGDMVFWPVQAAPRNSTVPASSAADEEKMEKYRAAAPLNHTVRIERIGSYLKFDYELIGADGKKHDLWGISEHPELTFSVYRGDARVGIGKFEFG
ncbi:MAG TPA: hypothetical protein VLI39_01740 [Sedimentisphaerales bacterium]|nr:hypothetical protein [Sedimentisphaerales bacterium]